MAKKKTAREEAAEKFVESLDKFQITLLNFHKNPQAGDLSAARKDMIECAKYMYDSYPES